MVTLVNGDLYQWDTGRVVLVDPSSEYNIHEVHFSTRKLDFAYVANTYSENGNIYCAIPNILLQQYYDIYCYEVRENADGEESVSTTVFKVTKRNRPLDYVYTEPEKYTYKELKKRIEKLEGALAGKADKATTLADYGITDAYNKTEIDSAIAAINFIPNPTTASVGQTIVVKAVDDAGKPIEWEPVDLPEQVQSDWNQNDENAVDYVRNKPLIATDEDALDFLVDMGITMPVTNSKGEILISSSNEIYYLQENKND